MSSWNKSCDNCHEMKDKLRRCTGCFMVYYCSTDCQRADWKKRHKRTCVGTATKLKKTKKMDEKLSQLSLDEKKKAEILDENQNIKLPSESDTNDDDDDDYEDYSFDSDDFNTDTDDEDEDEEEEEDGLTRGTRCAICDSRKNLKTCSQCKRVSYCSRDCQREDWKKHKLNCIKSYIETVVLKERGSKKMHVKALQIAKSLYHMRRVTASFYDFMTYPSLDALVVYIKGYHPYFLRHGLYIKDKNGEELTVFFYLDHGDPSPYFSWDDLEPGRYICIMDAQIHNFLDGQVGIRIEEPRDIRLLEV